MIFVDALAIAAFAHQCQIEHGDFFMRSQATDPICGSFIPKRPKNVRNGFGYVWLLRKCSQAGLNAMATPGFDFLQPGASCQDIPVGRVLPWQLQVSSEIVGCGWRSFIRCARR